VATKGSENLARLAPTRRVGLALFLLLLTIVAVDLLTGRDMVLTTAYAIPVLVGALFLTPRQTAWFGVICLGTALGSGAVNDIWLTSDHLVRLAIVAVATVMAVVGARVGGRAASDISRLELLSGIGEAASGGTDLADAAERILDVLVPVVADGAYLDLLEQDGPPRRIASLRWDSVEPRQRRVLVVPVSLAGRDIGLLGVMRARPRQGFSRTDERLLKVITGRIALTIDNARLVDDIARSQRELNTTLAGLAEAITVHDVDGQTVYANAAAARLLGAASVDEVVAAKPGELAARFEMTHPDGRPVGIDEFPGRRLFAGDLSPAPLLTRSVERATGREYWLLTKATPVLDSEGRPRLAVNIIEDLTEETRAEQDQRLLAEAGEVLGLSLDLDETLSQIAALAVPRLADWCSVDLPGNDGIATLAAIAHADGSKTSLGRELRERYPVRLDEPEGLAAVLRGGPRFLQEDIAEESLAGYATDADHLELLRGVGFRHVLIVPMRIGAETIGALTFVISGPDRRFGEADIALAEELARRAGTAVLNARLFATRAEIAETLQRSLRPPGLPAIPGLELATLYRAAGEASDDVGGDFYDFYPLPGGQLIVIGDVTGKGPAAAALTALARAVLEGVATHTGSPIDALRRFNELLLQRGELALCSVALLYLRATPGDAVLAEVICAGHPPLLLVRGGAVEPLGAGGPLVGAFADAEWEAERVPLQQDDVLVLRTDGVAETVGSDGRLGEERVLAALAGMSSGAPEAVDRIVRLVDRYRVGPQRDDTAIVAVEIEDAVAFAASELERCGRRDDAGVPDGWRRAFDLDGTPGSVTAVRHRLEAMLAPDLPAEVVADACLIVSELASNAVTHGGAGAYRVTVELEQRSLRIAVHDRGGGPVAPAPVWRPEGAGGYGLALVERLATRWGIERARGTVVWAELDLAPVAARQA
jgi:PAS domain S-box-containing protein